MPAPAFPPAAVIMIVVIPAASAIIVVTVVVLVVRAIVRRKIIVIPAVLYKVDWIVAGIIAAAILTPSFSVARRDAHVDRFIYINVTMNQNWLSINQAWLRIWVITDIDAAVKSGLANADGNADIRCNC